MREFGFGFALLVDSPFPPVLVCQQRVLHKQVQHDLLYLSRNLPLQFVQFRNLFPRYIQLFRKRVDLHREVWPFEKYDAVSKKMSTHQHERKVLTVSRLHLMGGEVSHQRPL